MQKQTTLLPKQKAIYEGIIELMEEGVNITNITVSEIAKRAGIGKGTVYEYFSTKEEAVAQSLVYCFANALTKLREKLFREETLKGKMNIVFDWLLSHQSGYSVLMQLKGFQEENLAMREEIIRAMDKEMIVCAKYEDILNNVLESGVREQCIKMPKTNFQRDAALFSVLAITMGFILKKETEYKDTSWEEAKQYIYTIFIKILE